MRKLRVWSEERIIENPIDTVDREEATAQGTQGAQGLGVKGEIDSILEALVH